MREAALVNFIVNVILGTALGIILGAMLVFLFDRLDRLLSGGSK